MEAAIWLLPDVGSPGPGHVGPACTVRWLRRRAAVALAWPPIRGRPPGVGSNVAYKIVWEPPSGVLKQHYGAVTGEEILQAVVEVEGNARFDELRYVINDLSRCTEFSVDREYVDLVAAIDRAASLTNRNIRIAIVAADPAIVDMAAHFAESPVNVYPTRLFATLEDARTWVGRPPEPAGA
jgi:hypothetical protein